MGTSGITDEGSQRPASAEGRDAASGEVMSTGTAPPAEPECGEVEVLVEILQPGSAVRRARTLVAELLEWAEVSDEDGRDAQLIVMELAANAERHSRPPYELRVYSQGGVPVWCEIVDGDPDLGEIPAMLARPPLPAGGEEADLPLLDLLAEGGRGLLLATHLSYGSCRTYPTRTTGTGRRAKAVGFALPTRTGSRLIRPDSLPPSPPRLSTFPTSSAG